MAKEPASLRREIAMMADAPGETDDSVTGWQRRLLGDAPSRVIGKERRIRAITVGMDPFLSTALSIHAKEEGVNREVIMRRALAAYMAEVMGTTPEALMPHLVPRTWHKKAYQDA